MLTTTNENRINEMMSKTLIDIKVTMKLIDDLEKEIFLSFMDEEGVENKQSMIEHYEKALYRNMELLKALRG